MNLAALGNTLLDRIAAATGLEVDAERLAISALSGTVSVDGLTLRLPGGPPTQPPLLTVRRVRAQVGLRALLSGKVHIREAAIERPRVYGSLQAIDQLGPIGGRGASIASPEVTADRVVLVDGAVHLTGPGGVAVRAEGISLELAHRPGGYEATLLADHVGPPGATESAAWPGELQATAHLRGMDDLARLREASLNFQAQLRSRRKAALELAVNGSAETLAAVDFTVEGFAPMAALLELLGEQAYRLPGVAGRLKLRARGRLDGAGLAVPELVVTGTDLRRHHRGAT